MPAAQGKSEGKFQPSHSVRLLMHAIGLAYAQPHPQGSLMPLDSFMPHADAERHQHLRLSRQLDQVP